MIEILENAGFEEVLREGKEFAIFPGITVEPGPKTVAVLDDITVKWDRALRSLILEGTDNASLVDSLKKISKSFNESNYNFSRIVNYFEVFSIRKMNIKDFVEKLRSKIGFSMKFGEEDLYVYSVALSNREGPVGGDNFYNWRHLSFEPDVNAPNEIVYIKLVARFKDLDTLLSFVKNLDDEYGKIQGNIFG
ncbi:MAG: hypothetical protein ACP6IP_10905 [Candidatus Njordarchaeia archaeon]